MHTRLTLPVAFLGLTFRSKVYNLRAQLLP